VTWLAGKKCRCRLSIAVAAAFLVDQSEADHRSRYNSHRALRNRGLARELFQASRSIGKRLKQTDLACSKKLFCRHKPGRNLQDRFGCDRLHDALPTVAV